MFTHTISFITNKESHETSWYDEQNYNKMILNFTIETTLKDTSTTDEMNVIINNAISNRILKCCKTTIVSLEKICQNIESTYRPLP